MHTLMRGVYEVSGGAHLMGGCFGSLRAPPMTVDARPAQINQRRSSGFEILCSMRAHGNFVIMTWSYGTCHRAQASSCT